MRFRKNMAMAVGVAAALAAGPASAQVMTDAEFAGYIQDLQRTGGATTTGRVAIAGIPSGFLTPPGQMKATLSGSYGPRRGAGMTRFDASTSLAVGFGDPVDAVGVEVALVNLSFRRFGRSGYFTVGFHRQFSTGAGGTGSLALTVDRLGVWGDAKGSSVGGTLVFSTTGTVQTASGPMPVMTSFGAGTNVSRNQKAGVIAAVGVGLSSDWSVSGGVYGDSALVGATWHPVGYPGLTVGSTIRKQAGSKPIFGVDVGYAFNIFGG